MTNSNSSLYQPGIFTGDISTSSDSGIIPVTPTIETNTGDLTYTSSQAKADFQENQNVPEDSKTKMFCKIPFLNLQRMDLSQTEQQNEMTRNTVDKVKQWLYKPGKEKKVSPPQPICEGAPYSKPSPFTQATQATQKFMVRVKESLGRGRNPKPTPSPISSLAGTSRLSSRLSNASDREPSSNLERFAGSSLPRLSSQGNTHSVSTEAHRHTESVNVGDLKNYATNSAIQRITPSFQGILRELLANDEQSFNKLINAVLDCHKIINKDRSDFGLGLTKETPVQTLANVSQSTLSTEETPLLTKENPLSTHLSTEESVENSSVSAQKIIKDEAANKTMKKVRSKVIHSNSLFKTLKLKSRNPDQISFFLKRALENPLEKNGQILPLFFQSSNSYERNSEIKEFFFVNSSDSAKTAEADDLLIEALKDVKLGCVKLLKDCGETKETRRLIEDFFQNILQFSAHGQNIEIDHYFLHALVEGLKFVSFAFDGNSLSSQATSVLTSKNTNQMKGFPTNRDLPKDKQDIKLRGLEAYFFELFKYSMSDNSVGLSLQLDSQKYKYSGKGRVQKPFCNRAEKIAEALEITEKDFTKLKKTINVTADKVDLTDNEIKNNVSDLMDSARCEAKDLCDRVTKTLNGKGESYGIPTDMEYLFFYLRVKSGIIQYLLSQPKNDLLHVDNFDVVEDKLDTFFKEINSFQFLLERILKKNCDHIVEEEIKKPLKRTLQNVINFDIHDNQIVKKYNTLPNFINWLEGLSNKTNKFLLYDFEKAEPIELIKDLLQQSSQFPITARIEKTLLGENHYIYRHKKSDCPPEIKNR